MPKPTLAEAKANFAKSIENANPVLAIKARPLRSMAIAAASGAILGASAGSRKKTAILADIAISYIFKKISSS
ncbi:MAG: hypothetical protein LBT31_06255 [Synergistaceae bacterium]|jgi:hypothetical protein|nr:hypothetical protein [Synergistaceae bacterium]